MAHGEGRVVSGVELAFPAHRVPWLPARAVTVPGLLAKGPAGGLAFGSTILQDRTRGAGALATPAWRPVCGNMHGQARGDEPIAVGACVRMGRMSGGRRRSAWLSGHGESGRAAYQTSSTLPLTSADRHVRPRQAGFVLDGGLEGGGLTWRQRQVDNSRRPKAQLDGGELGAHFWYTRRRVGSSEPARTSSVTEWVRRIRRLWSPGLGSSSCPAQLVGRRCLHGGPRPRHRSGGAATQGAKGRGHGPDLTRAAAMPSSTWGAAERPARMDVATRPYGVGLCRSGVVSVSASWVRRRGAAPMPGATPEPAWQARLHRGDPVRTRRFWHGLVAAAARDLRWVDRVLGWRHPGGPHAGRYPGQWGGGDTALGAWGSRLRAVLRSISRGARCGVTGPCGSGGRVVS